MTPDRATRRRYHGGHLAGAASVGLLAGVLVVAGIKPGPAPVAVPTVYARPAAVPGTDADGGQVKRGGIERWSVKTGADPLARSVALGAPHAVTVEDMRALPRPVGFVDAKGDDPKRWPGVETTEYAVTGTIVGYKLETDNDYHIIVQGSQAGDTLVCEIPDPDCVAASSAWRGAIAKARAAFQARFANIGPRITACSVPARLTGIGFFDRVHGQAGVAPTGIELHPVLGVEFQ